jgi:sphingolipid 4-desaturase/C4-monooxygenase
MNPKTAKPSHFTYSTSPEPHKIRTKEILKNHPEIRNFVGKNPSTFLWIVGIVAGQTVLAFWLQNQPWWLLLIVAYTAGALANHSLFVLIHECTHNLVFNKRMGNTLAGIVANLPLVVPSSVSFQRYHLKHHAFQGVYELDADLPYEWEAKVFGNSVLGKALWLLFYPIFQGLRPLRLKEINFFEGWIFLNWLVQFSFNIAVFVFFGTKALLYLLISLFFSIGLHPLGARWIQRHYLVAGEQETYSYYGALNTLAFNVGYHNEHHDFPSVPWNNLPKVKAGAREYYDSLVSHKSWTKLLFQFLFDPTLSLYSRVVRDERGQVALNAEVQPDIDAIKQTQSA